MSNRLKGKVAIVFGAGQTPGPNIGNGRASAITYAREGASVACVDRDIAGAEQTQAIITEAGGNAITLCADVTREQDVAAAVAACVEAFGPIDILHNNVGGAEGDKLDPIELSESTIDSTVALTERSFAI